MAIEAATQIMESQGTEVRSYTLQDVKFLSALELSDSYNAEVLLRMRTIRTGTIQGKATWFEFTVSSVDSEDRWTEHVTGRIATMQDLPGTSPIVAQWPQAHNAKASYSARGDMSSSLNDSSANWKQKDVAELYSAFAAVGQNYGPAFQKIQKFLVSDEDEASAQVISDLSHGMILESRYLVYPTILDAFLQLPIIVANKSTPEHFTRPYLVVSVDRMSICKPSADTHLKSETTSTQGTRLGAGSVSSTINAVDDQGKILVSMDASYHAIPSRETSGPVEIPSHPFSKLVWMPDVDRLDSRLAPKLFPPVSIGGLLRQVEEAAAWCILDHGNLLENRQLAEYAPSLRPFVSWLMQKKAELSLREHRFPPL